MFENQEHSGNSFVQKAARGTGAPHRAEGIYNKICADLQKGIYAPGDKLVLRELAAEFGVSLTPVRDALNRLVGERVLEMRPNRTIAVPIPLAAEVREVRRIRMEIEGFAAAEAASRISVDELEQVELACDRYVAARKSGDAVVTLEANRVFHFSVYAAARMPFLLEIINGFWLRNGPLQHLLLQSGTPRFDRSDTLHRAVLDALRDRDEVAARKGVSDDIDYPTNDIIMALAELRESQGR